MVGDTDLELRTEVSAEWRWEVRELMTLPRVGGAVMLSEMRTKRTLNMEH